MTPMSDPEINDIDRTGQDLLDRIAELTDAGQLMEGPNGWRPLLVACRFEILKMHLKFGEAKIAADKADERTSRLLLLYEQTGEKLAEHAKDLGMTAAWMASGRKP